MNDLCDLRRDIDIVDSDDEDGSDNVVGATTEEIITIGSIIVNMFWGTSQVAIGQVNSYSKGKHRLQ